MTMERNSETVNSARRRYYSTGRRERARQARDQAVGVAEELFLSRGYAATTVAAIAAQAQVSVETIYKGFGGKPGLVRAIIEKGLAGRGPVPAEQRSDRIRDTEPDPRRILTAWGEFVAEIAPRTAPILLLARDAAAADPELAALLDEVGAARLERMTVNARGLDEACAPAARPHRGGGGRHHVGVQRGRVLRVDGAPPGLVARPARPVRCPRP